MKDILNIAFGAALTLSGALLVNFLNNKKEKKRLVAKLKSEAIALCSKISMSYVKSDFYSLQSISIYRIYDITNKIDYKVIGDTLFERGLDSSFDIANLRAALLSTLVELYHYINDTDIVYLKNKSEESRNVTPRDFDFQKFNTEQEVIIERTKLSQELVQYHKSTAVYIQMEDIKKRLSPHI